MQIVLFLQSANREKSGRAGLWSRCLVPLNAWQLARIMLKITNILTFNWSPGSLAASDRERERERERERDNDRGRDREKEKDRESFVSSREGSRKAGRRDSASASKDSKPTVSSLLSEPRFNRAVCQVMKMLLLYTKNITLITTITMILLF